MKIEYLDDYSFNIYLSKYYLPNFKLDDKQWVEDYFKQMFINLKNNRHLDIYGYYNIRVYANKQYGLIIDVFKLSNDYFKMPGNKVDMKIMIDRDNNFLYEVEDYFIAKSLNESIKDIYFKDGKFYLELSDIVDEISYYSLMEHSKIVFNDNAYDIITSSIKL
ncbi:MAG: hypothetical protein WC343_02890 [Bacilli bacterium]|jgi:hypothetical protein